MNVTGKTTNVAGESYEGLPIYESAKKTKKPSNITNSTSNDVTFECA